MDILKINKFLFKLLIIFLFFLIIACVPNNNILLEDNIISPSVTFSPTPILKTYQEILAQEIKPKIQPNYKFPVSVQYRNGCFAFAVNHILRYKYNLNLDLYEVEKKIAKPREELWKTNYVNAFITEYNLKMKWYRDAENLFDLLQKGEPVVIQYNHDLGNDKWVGHLVAAYSFDNQGIWISDSLDGKRKRLAFLKVFEENNTYLQYGFATIEK